MLFGLVIKTLALLWCKISLCTSFQYNRRVVESSQFCKFGVGSVGSSWALQVCHEGPGTLEACELHECHTSVLIIHWAVNITMNISRLMPRSRAKLQSIQYRKRRALWRRVTYAIPVQLSSNELLTSHLARPYKLKWSIQMDNGSQRQPILVYCGRNLARSLWATKWVWVRKRRKCRQLHC